MRMVSDYYQAAAAQAGINPTGPESIGDGK